MTEEPAMPPAVGYTSRTPRAARPRATRAGPPGGRNWAVADFLVAGLGVFAALLCLRAKGNYAAAPWFGLIAPAVLLLASAGYRSRAGAALRASMDSLAEFRRRGGTPPWKAGLLLAVLPAILVDFSNNDLEGSGDTRPVIPTAVSLVTQGNWDLDEFDRPGRPDNLFGRGPGLAYDLTRRHGRVYSAYPAGMVALATPVVALARVAGADLASVPVQARLEKIVATLVEATSLGLFLLIAARLAPIPPAILATAILGLGSGMFSTVAQGAWQHGGIVLAMLSVLLAEVAREGGPGRLGILAQGVACGLLPSFRLTAASFLLPFGAWMLRKSPRRALAVVSLAAVVYLPWAAFYLSTYGSLFGPSTSQMDGSSWTTQIGWPLVGLLASPGRGLLVYQPWVVLAVLAFVPQIARSAGSQGVSSGPRGFMTLCAMTVAAHLLLISAWKIWYGGYCWGSRLVVETQPLLALLALPGLAVLWSTRRGRTTIAALAIAGALMQVPGVYLRACRWNIAVGVDVHPESVWSWSDPPFLAPWHGKAGQVPPGG
jgi:hypothetical protein